MKNAFFVLLLMLNIIIFVACRDEADVINYNENIYYLQDTGFLELTNGPYGLRVMDLLINDKDNLYIMAGNYEKFDGLYKSTDHGATWTNVTERFGSSPNNYSLEADDYIVAHDIKTRTYIYSSDGGATWTTFLMDIPDIVSITQIKIDSKGNFYALCFHYDYQKHPYDRITLYKSMNKGRTWNKLKNPIAHSSSSELFIDRNNVIYLYYFDRNIEKRVLCRSTDNGKTWTERQLDMNAQNLTFDKDGNIYSNLKTISTDMGETWMEFGKQGLYRDESHGDFHNVFISPEKNIFLTSDSYVYRSTDQGRTWRHILHTTDLNSIVIDSRGYMFALRNNNILYKSINKVEKIWE